jgi:NADP-dependent 3-hydroxy acid dehydrogenase YdfG
MCLLVLVQQVSVPVKPRLFLAGTINQSRTDVFTKTVAINYLGVVHSVKAVLPGMLERQHGRILLLSSMQAAIRKITPFIPL